MELTTATCSLAESTTYGSAYRFENVTIPPGATITACTVSLYFTSTGYTGAIALDFNAVANPSTLGSSTSYISGLTLTGNPVTWTLSGVGSTGFNASPSLVTPFQAIVNQGSWASGNAVLLVAKVTSSGGIKAVEMYDGSPSEAAEISVTYTVSSAASKGIAPLFNAGVPLAPLFNNCVPLVPFNSSY